VVRITSNCFPAFQLIRHVFLLLRYALL